MRPCFSRCNVRSPALSSSSAVSELRPASAFPGGGNMSTLKPWTALFVLALVSLPLRAEIIQLKNGNKISGKVTAINGDTFVVKTDYGDMQVPRTDIVSISFSDAPAQPADAKPPAPPVDEALIDGVYVN